MVSQKRFKIGSDLVLDVCIEQEGATDLNLRYLDESETYTSFWSLSIPHEEGAWPLFDRLLNEDAEFWLELLLMMRKRKRRHQHLAQAITEHIDRDRSDDQGNAMQILSEDYTSIQRDAADTNDQLAEHLGDVGAVVEASRRLHWQIAAAEAEPF
jgi:hypothetical protein